MNKDDIQTEHVYPPIPDRNYDWAATLKGYEPGDLIGRGRTKELAIEHLVAQVEETLPDNEGLELALALAPKCTHCDVTLSESEIENKKTTCWGCDLDLDLRNADAGG